MSALSGALERVAKLDRITPAARPVDQSVEWFHCSARPGGATCGLERAHVAEQSSGSTSLGYSSAPSGVEDALEVLPHEIVREGVKVVLRAIQRERDSILEEPTADQLFIHLNSVEGKSNTKVE